MLESGETSKFMAQYNPTNSNWGSHITALAAAALSTSGDILECGTGLFSTPLLHEITKLQGRMLVSADTELNWLYQFQNLTGDNHQIIGIPVYEDGANCGVYPGARLTPLDYEQISFVGKVEKRLTNNKNIECPR